MAITSSYKTQAVHQRVMTTESVFTKGMKYTNQPLPEGYIKTLINFDIKDDGETIKPRGGLQNYTDVVATIAHMYTNNPCSMHNSGVTYVMLPDESDAILCHYAVFGQCTTAKNFRLQYAQMLVEYDGEYFCSEYDNSIDGALSYQFLTMTPPTTSMHGMNITTPYITSNGVSASIDANTYVIVHNPNADKGLQHVLGRIYVWFTYDSNKKINGIKWCVKRVMPQEIAATQVVNYGYNLLKPDPYNFENTTTATGALVLNGILPYNSDGKLMLSARPGAEITFKLNYQYPAGTNDRYLTQWELQNLDADTDVTVVQPVYKSPATTPGDDIEVKVKPTFKHFSVIAKVYLQSTFESSEKTAPDQVLTLSSYYLTADNKSTSKFSEPKAFDLGTASGMCAWQHRLVVWGVDNAKNSIFVSDINSPDYFPYPNGTEIFTNNVIGCVPYMSDLLIFTTDSLYRATLSDDGLSYKVDCIQERLNMIESDINTIQTVQNMVYFKSNEYFYMIVPKAQSLTGELQLAPVSRPIEYILDHFEDCIHNFLNEVYNIDFIPYTKEVKISLADFFVYLDGNQIRNSYKLKIDSYARNNVLRTTYYMDLQLNYDTVLRCWSVYINQSNQNRDAVFRPTATGKAIFYRIYRSENVSKVILMKYNDDNHKDTATLYDDANYTFGNYQYIDTGYRQHNQEFKKRYREIDFFINCLGKEKLKFYTGFVLDDDVRRSYYKHKTEHCTDKDDASYGMLFVERVLDDDVDGESLTLLDTGWELDTSQFPDLTVTKIRYKVSGKGYNAAVKLLSKNEADFEILDVSWVYRTMFAR